MTIEDKKKKNKKFLEKPQYPGGAKAFREFVKAHLQYPQDAMEQRIEGVVTIGYQVNDDGFVENPTVIKSLCPSCNEEAIRLVQMLRYDKARNRGIRLKVNCKLNINFHLAPAPPPTGGTISYTLQPTKKTAKDKKTPNPSGSGSYNYTISW